MDLIKFKVGGRWVGLNPRLVKIQGLEKSDIDNIVKIMRKISRHLNKMEKLTNKFQIRDAAVKWHELQYELQTAWKFPLDKKFHRFWELPHCECPTMDNLERWGTEYTIKTNKCVIHGFDE